ncbi:NAD(P)H-dependent oxidoreductase [Vibrio sp.]|nr:NAD(P)H-dependent oxidoreductase [Vibrio sp.]
MKIVAFGASSSTTSINKVLASYTANLVSDADVKVLDINDYNVPIFSEDVEKEIGQAEGAKAFLADLSQADAFIISFAEHNGSYTAAYKNLFDWTTRIERSLFGGKPAVYLSTSPGPGGAQTVLASALASAPHFGAEVRASVSVPRFYDNVQEGAVINDEIIQELKKAIVSLQK